MPESTPREKLLTCLQLFLSGDWAFVQLRGEAPDEKAFDGDDIDLLGAESSVDALLDAAQEWVRDGMCHIRVVRQRQRKLEFFLYSIDGRHSLHFDLWIELPQLDGGRDWLSFDHVTEIARPEDGGFLRLPLDVEASVFVHHLVCKKKALSDPKQQQRLASYTDRCTQEGHTELAQRLTNIRTTGSVSMEDESFTLEVIRNKSAAKNGVGRSAAMTHPRNRLVSNWLAAPRKTGWISIMGCDGAGKTSLATEIAAKGEVIDRVYTGKHLYRKSLLYKLAVIFIRPLTFQSRENFDEVISPLVYLRACFGLRLKILFSSSKVTFVDRALPDFLYLDRKTDHPKFSRFSWLMRWFGCRIPVAHCLTSFENVQKRKDEVTAAGHKIYDDTMYALHTKNCPTDYVAFNNDGTLEESAATLSRIVKRPLPRRG